MLILIIFGIVLALSLGLSFYNSNNHDTIKDFYQDNQCQAVSYYQGKYLGVCADDIIMYQNSLVLDMDSPTFKIPANKVQKIDIIVKEATATANAKNKILMTLDNSQQVMLDFESKEQLEQFKGAIHK